LVPSDHPIVRSPERTIINTGYFAGSSFVIGFDCPDRRGALIPVKLPKKPFQAREAARRSSGEKQKT
jgi:hypothetical protein